MASLSLGRISAGAPASHSSGNFSFHLQDVQWLRPDGTPLWQQPVSLAIGTERLGIVGRNGVGKSMLLRLLSGQLEAARGEVRRRGRVHIVSSVRGEAVTVAQAMGLGAIIDAVQRLQSGTAAPEDLVVAEGHWDIGSRIAQALAEAGLSGLLPMDSVDRLSGGERMRVALAGAMAADADSVLLDEPSNHLDTAARAWLLDWLRAARRTVVLASHDRGLLQAVDRIVEVSPRGLAVHGGNYALYAAQRKAHDAAAEAALAHARNERDLIVSQLRREHDARQHRQAQASRRARTANLPRIVLSAMKNRAEETSARQARHDADRRASLDDAVRQAARRVDLTPAAFLALPACRVPPAKAVLSLEGVRLPHPHTLPIDAALCGPVRVALSGPNGCGKSTLLRVIAGSLAPRCGVAQAHVATAWLDQDGGDALPSDACLLDHLQALRSPLPVSELRTRLAQLRLDAARVESPMRLLSAGERIKAALACAVWRGEPARLLLLDEPTNHIDLDTALVLERALQDFEGALIVASHDAAFVDALRPTHRWTRHGAGWRLDEVAARASSG